MRTEYVATDTPVPPELVRQVEVKSRKVAGLKDVTLVVADLKEGLEVANGRLNAVACILHPEEAADPRACGAR
ncbi:MAG: hypothetical protein ABJL99_10195 [Aliishimia sp.]